MEMELVGKAGLEAKAGGSSWKRRKKMQQEMETLYQILYSYILSKNGVKTKNQWRKKK
jgi:hypothetical protein